VRLLQLQFGGVLAGDDALVGSMKAGQQLSSVVLPEPVPPEISTLQRRAPMMRRISAPSARSSRTSPGGERQLVLLELTNGERGPSIASGGAMTLTREPSGRRASQIGRGFVDAAADLAHDALADVHQLRVVAEADVGRCILPPTSM
jgi:hypothetical protein